MAMRTSLGDGVELKSKYHLENLISDGQAIRRRPNGEFELWQRRFWEHTIRNDADFARHVDYIHFNPVKNGLVSRVYDWPHSSFHSYVRRGSLPKDWGGDGASDGQSFGERRS